MFDFLDGLVAVGLLEREGSGETGRYANTRDTSVFLDTNSPHYIGGILEMANARLYGFWDGLTEALQTGQPQNEIKHTGKSMFEGLYADPARLEQFMRAMSGISAGNFHALAEKFDFSPYSSVCDVGGATGQLSIILAEAHPHLTCTSLTCRRWNLFAARDRGCRHCHRVAAASGDFFGSPLPQADVITMGMILHDWNLEKKRSSSSPHMTLAAGRRADRGENIIDDDRLRTSSA